MPEASQTTSRDHHASLIVFDHGEELYDNR
jgi:hypothetical protein